MKLIQSIVLLAVVSVALEAVFLASGASADDTKTSAASKASSSKSTRSATKSAGAPKIRRTIRIREQPVVESPAPAKGADQQPQSVELSNSGANNQIEVKPSISIEQASHQPSPPPPQPVDKTDDATEDEQEEEKLPAQLKSPNGKVSVVPYRARKKGQNQGAEDEAKRKADNMQIVVYEEKKPRGQPKEQEDEERIDGVIDLRPNKLNQNTVQSGNEINNLLANSGNHQLDLANNNNNAKHTVVSNVGNSEVLHIDGVGNKKVTRITDSGNEHEEEEQKRQKEKQLAVVNNGAPVLAGLPELNVRSTGQLAPFVQINLAEPQTNKQQQQQPIVLPQAPVIEFVVNDPNGPMGPLMPANNYQIPLNSPAVLAAQPVARFLGPQPFVQQSWAPPVLALSQRHQQVIVPDLAGRQQVAAPMGAHPLNLVQQPPRLGRHSLLHPFHQPPQAPVQPVVGPFAGWPMPMPMPMPLVSANPLMAPYAQHPMGLFYPMLNPMFAAPAWPAASLGPYPPTMADFMGRPKRRHNKKSSSRKDKKRRNEEKVKIIEVPASTTTTTTTTTTPPPPSTTTTTTTTPEPTTTTTAAPRMMKQVFVKEVPVPADHEHHDHHDHEQASGSWLPSMRFLPFGAASAPTTTAKPQVEHEDVIEYETIRVPKLRKRPVA